MIAELQVRQAKYGRSERSKSRDMRRSLEDSSCEDSEDWPTDDDQSGSDFKLTRITLTSMIATSRPPTTLSVELRQSGRTAGLRIAGVAETSLTEGSTVTPATKALTDVAVSIDRVQHAEELTILPTTVSSVVNCASNPPTETGLVPIGLPQLASPPVDTDCVYAFVDESKWLNTQRREEAKEANTTEIEKERNGSFSGGESDERKIEEWNSGGSEGLVSSVTQKTWHDYQPENVIKLLSGEMLGWWSAQKFDKRVRIRALVQGAVNDARTRSLLDTGANISVISERFAKQLRLREFDDYARELAFLPDLTEAASTTLDYTGPHVWQPSLSVEHQDRVVKVLKSHVRIMISSGNTLPPPAYGVVCDIDVQGHPPIEQKARRIPLLHSETAL
ncbi:unnamed protein product [Phytophthora fragariaefolia]|uniref:Unnamed protein product n=1 Tax=Phytophthora fragariaefolia TaxID=1490495 RepID=A0A9W6WS15_9STRA|nr:unnamed protein product [Phytophthora fragariaefolia]